MTAWDGILPAVYIACMGGAGEWAGGFRFFHGSLTLGRLDGWTSDQRWTENAGSGRGYPPKISRSRSRCARPTPRSRHADCLGFRHGEMIRSHSGYLLLLALLQRYVVGFMSAKSEPAVNPMRGVCILYFSLYEEPDYCPGRCCRCHVLQPGCPALGSGQILVIGPGRFGSVGGWWCSTGAAARGHP